MASTTPNIGLTVWDSNDDIFDPEVLESNFRIIDSKIVEARPTDRAEILSSIPTSGNFDGRLVYLTSSSNGIPAKSLIRFDGSSWRTVGPYEILPSLPTNGNFSGRLVLLSEATADFAAWTLVVCTSTTPSVTWESIGRRVDVVDGNDLSGLTGNYAGRLVVLSSGTTYSGKEFYAWDLIRWNGSTWDHIGPQRNPSEVSVASQLPGAESGKQALISFGSSAYGHSTNVNYSSTFTQWMVPWECPLTSQIETFATTSITDTLVSSVPPAYHDWKVWDTAGWKPQYRLFADISSSNASGTTYVGLVQRQSDRGAGGTLTSYGELFGQQSNTGTTTIHVDSGWVDPPSTTVRDSACVAVAARTNNVSYTATVNSATIWLRWTKK